MTSTVIDFVRDGHIMPIVPIENSPSGSPASYDGAVYHADGNLCELSRTIKARHREQPAPLDDGPVEELQGAYVFAGRMQNGHFGHFIAENLARLWSVDLLSNRFDKLVFYLRTPKLGVPSYAKQVLNILFPDIGLTIVSRHAVCDQVAVPSEILNGSYIYGHPSMRSLCARLKFFDPTIPEKVFVSRSKLTRTEGGYLLDHRLDTLMQEAGYKVIYPEQMSVREQLTIYHSAKFIVFAEGSAAHLYALVATTRQRVFIIWRRGKYGIFDWQIRSFDGPNVMGEVHFKELWAPEVDGGDRTRAKAILDFVSLSRELISLGFMDGRAWEQPSDEDFASEIERVAAVSNRKWIKITD